MVSDGSYLMLVLEAAGGAIKGRTMFQKLAYFVGKLVDRTQGLDFRFGDLGYAPGFYGPYSRRLACELDALVALGSVDRFSMPTGRTDRRGFEVFRHDYVLTDRGRKALAKKKASLPRTASAVRASMERILSAGKLDYLQLSVAAMSLFLVEERRGPTTESEIAEMAKEFGWTVSSADVGKAVGFLSALDLVEVTPT
jgi:uncharacterized protein YwgA